MRAWNSIKVWKRLSHQLAVAEEDDFERKVLPLLQLLWPGLQQAPRKKSWDADGIDLLEWTDHGAFPCVVQCKGFKVHELGNDQIRQIERSIKKYIASRHTARTYLLIHNRDSRNHEFVQRVQASLQEIVSLGKAEEAFLWDRQQILNYVFDSMEGRVNTALRDYSDSIAKQVRGLFRFGGTHIRDVPVIEEEITFSREKPCTIKRVKSRSTRDIGALLKRSSGKRWIILTGHFGMGKTSSALAAAMSTDMPAVFVPCVSIPADVFTHGGTNKLTRHIAQVLLDDESQSQLDEGGDAFKDIAGAVLVYLLRHGESPFVFILDGLDEHHVFASLEGLERLCNQIAEFSCGVVLTTRREHFEEMLGSFNMAFAALSPKHGNQRVTKVLVLDRWEKSQTMAAISSAIHGANLDEAAKLEELRIALGNHTAENLYGELLYHPLFLQFILEEVAANGLCQANRVQLLSSWIERKIRRDRLPWARETVTERVHVQPEMDMDEFVERMHTGMEQVAYAMIADTADGCELLESLEGGRVVEIFENVFRQPSIQLLPILLNSVLLTHGPRQGVQVRVAFALRILHEYFLASYAVRNRLDIEKFPKPVQRLSKEMHQT